MLLFQWWQRGCSAWPCVASLTQPGVARLNQMALSHVWMLLFMHVINVPLFWLISYTDWEAFAFVINELAAQQFSTLVHVLCTLMCLCVLLLNVQHPSNHSQRSSWRKSTHNMSGKFNMARCGDMIEASFPVSVSLVDKEKKADTGTDSPCM